MRARVVIYNEQLKAILLINRIKKDRNYWVIPGGGAKGTETPVETAIREIDEELQLKYRPEQLKQIFTLEEDEVQPVFWAETTVTVAPKISGEEVGRSNKDNIYRPAFVKVSDLKKVNLMPPEATDKILLALENK
ncbi:NUDIX domain-containing protein [Lactobacillus sp. ESL0791]|uniref:NUDIX domain-containing protein n=1 Tax=Lactobacillus sp. ESL0791 TaxID=2983234 RepID=UPI0023F89D3C|nr:NUDIX domain-containing protein [Lactobacillus sp. ESL0791]MDF7638072.1 NUDIX domain-containing protein [Lactobacillus sp. ESL0791]